MRSRRAVRLHRAAPGADDREVDHLAQLVFRHVGEFTAQFTHATLDVASGAMPKPGPDKGRDDLQAIAAHKPSHPDTHHAERKTTALTNGAI